MYDKIHYKLKKKKRERGKKKKKKLKRFQAQAGKLNLLGSLRVHVGYNGKKGSEYSDS